MMPYETGYDPITVSRGPGVLNFQSSSTFGIVLSFDRERHKQELLSAIGIMGRLRDNWYGNSVAAPTSSALTMARIFVSSLPQTKKQADLVQPDGDSGVSLVWKDAGGQTIATFDGVAIHLSHEDANGNVRFPPPTPYFGGSNQGLGADLLKYIPAAIR